MRSISLLLTSSLLAGCGGAVTLPPEHPRTLPKVVVDKEDPATLVAADGTICLVTAARYQATDIGDEVACRWRDPLER